MIYLVSNQEHLFPCDDYSRLEVHEAIYMIESWGPIIQWDSETSGRDAHICDFLCNQFGDYDGNIQIVVDNTTIDILLFKNILETKTLITVNGAFDCQFAFKYGIIPKNQWDCMVVEQTIFLGYDPKYFHCSFKAIADRRLHIDIDKSTRGEIIWRGLDKKVILYAAGDVQPLGKIRDLQLKDIEKRKISKAVEIENKFVVVNAYLMWCGIRLDINKWKKKIEDNETKRLKALDDLNNWVVEYSKSDKWKQNLKDGYYLYEEYHNGNIIKHSIPKGLQPHISNAKLEKDFGRTLKYVYCDAIFPYTYINRQGDLFEGFDLTPKCSINWNSAPQVADFMEMLGFNVVVEDRKTGKVKRTITEKVIKKQKGIADDFLKVYFEYTQKEKDCSTYGQNYIDAINPITDRIHTTFRQIGASSSRMSCGGGSKSKNYDLARYKHISPEKVGYPQIQNLPADEITRSSFIASPGNKWISVDYSAMESRLGADIYKEKSMIDEFIHGSGDIHSLCAYMVYKDDIPRDTKVSDIKHLYPKLRKDVKGVEFSQQFGGGWKAVADSLNCSKEQAMAFVDAYKEGFPGIAEFKEEGAKLVKSKGYVLICKHTGLKIWWEDFAKWKKFENTPEYIQKQEYTSDERKEHNMAGAKWERLSLNSPTQGTGAEIIKLAGIILFNYIIKNNYFNKVLICNIVHDEINVEVPEEISEEMAKVIVKCMEKSAEQLCHSLPIPAEASIGDHWIH